MYKTEIKFGREVTTQNIHYIIIKINIVKSIISIIILSLI